MYQTTLLVFFLPLVLSVVYITPDDYCGVTPSSQNYTYDNVVVKHVSLIIRHGDRAPANACWKDGPSWDCQNFGHIDKSTSESHTFDSLFLRNELPGTCEKGQLTRKGYDQHVQNGAFLRDLYINRLSFLPPHWNSKDFYIRTTNYQRTRLSAQGLIEGLYPIRTSINGSSSGEENRITFITGDKEQDNMFVNSAFCPLTKEVWSEVKSTEKVKEKEKLYGPLFQEIADIFGWSADRKPLEIFDCFQAHACNKMEFLEGMTPEMYFQIRYYVNWLHNEVYTSQQQNYSFAQIAMGSFVRDILDILDPVHSCDSSIKFALYGGHDTTIFPLLEAYKVWDGSWPSYASLLQIEMLSDLLTQNDFVRFIYRNKPLRLPECEFMELCPYEKFREISLKIISAASLCNKK